MNNNIRINSNSVAVRNAVDVLDGVYDILGELVEEIGNYSDVESYRYFNKILVCQSTLKSQIDEITKQNGEIYQLSTNKNSVKTTAK